jgi:GDP-L-fucose synthase
MKVLLTGGSGFLGRNIQEYFKSLKGYDLISVSSLDYDLRDSRACCKMLEKHRPDAIVHAAGSVGGILANSKNPGKFMYDNLAMGINMIENTRRYRDNHLYKVKFIMIGTVCSYPKHTPVPFKEESLWDGYPEETNAPYGIAKKTLMKLCETYHQQYELDIVNLIPVNMYGPHDHFNLTTSHVIPALILKFYSAIRNKRKKIEVWGTGEASREFLYAKDCAKAIESVLCYNLDRTIGPEPINIGTGQEITIKDLVDEIGEQMGFKGTIEWDFSRPDGQPRRCLDVGSAKKRLGFKAETDLKTGLRQTIDWFLTTKKQKETGE